jgi:hypothetical protein
MVINNSVKIFASTKVELNFEYSNEQIFIIQTFQLSELNS